MCRFVHKQMKKLLVKVDFVHKQMKKLLVKMVFVHKQMKKLLFKMVFVHEQMKKLLVVPSLRSHHLDEIDGRTQSPFTSFG